MKTEYTDNISKSRKRIRNSARLLHDSRQGEREQLDIYDDRGIICNNVVFQLCTIDHASKNKTIATMLFKDGANVAPHLHKNTESVFIVEGSLTETVSNNTYKEGDIITFTPGQIHGFQSDYALVVISWIPPFEPVA